jgi:hypothetical protein
MTRTHKPTSVGRRDYVLKRLADKNISEPHQFWRANFNGSGVEYACPGSDHSPDIRNYLKLIAVEDALDGAYSGAAEADEVAALEKEHATLLAPILLQARRSEHAGALGGGSRKSPMTKAANEAVQHGCISVEHALTWLKEGGSALCDFEDGDYIFSGDFADEKQVKRPTLKSIKQAINRELEKDAKNS